MTNEKELRERLGLPPRESDPAKGSSAATAAAGLSAKRRDSLNKYGNIKIVGRTVTFHEKRAHAGGGGRGGAARTAKPKSRDEKMRARERATTAGERRTQRRQKLLLLQEEKDRFDAMREIQEDTRRWKQ